MIRATIEGSEIITKQAVITQLNEVINNIQTKDSQGVVMIAFNPEEEPLIGRTLCYKIPGSVVIESLLDLAEHHNALELVLKGVIKRMLMKGGDAPTRM